MANKKQTESFNKIQREINRINIGLTNRNFKLCLESKQVSAHWYEYIIYSVQNDSKGGIVRKEVFSGKAEAVLGYVKGFLDATFIYASNV